MAKITNNKYYNIIIYKFLSFFYDAAAVKNNNNARRSDVETLPCHFILFDISTYHFALYTRHLNYLRSYFTFWLLGLKDIPTESAR